jgi:hypothetical protein
MTALLNKFVFHLEKHGFVGSDVAPAIIGKINRVAAKLQMK